MGDSKKGGRALPLPSVQTRSRLFCVRISWNPVEDAKGYEIFRGEKPDFAGAVKIGGTKHPTSRYEDGEAAGGKDYYYWVIATGDIGA